MLYVICVETVKSILVLMQIDLGKSARSDVTKETTVSLKIEATHLMDTRKPLKPLKHRYKALTH